MRGGFDDFKCWDWQLRPIAIKSCNCLLLFASTWFEFWTAFRCECTLSCGFPIISCPRRRPAKSKWVKYSAHFLRPLGYCKSITSRRFRPNLSSFWPHNQLFWMDGLTDFCRRSVDHHVCRNTNPCSSSNSLPKRNPVLTLIIQKTTYAVPRFTFVLTVEKEWIAAVLDAITHLWQLKHVVKC